MGLENATDTKVEVKEMVDMHGALNCEVLSNSSPH